MSSTNSRSTTKYVDLEEQHIIESLERDERVSVDNLPEALAEARTAATATLKVVDYRAASEPIRVAMEDFREA